MPDLRLRVLEREAVSGDPAAQRELLCYRIGRLTIEIPLEPSLMRKVGKGRYDGQTLWHDSEAGVTHPCVKWQTSDEEQFWDVVSEECVWKRPTWATTLGTRLSSVGAPTLVVGTPGPGEPGIMDALRDLSGGIERNPVREFPIGDFTTPIVESPHVPPDRMLLIPDSIAPFLREYPAQFESHATDAMLYAIEAANTLREGDEDETEGQEGGGGVPGHSPDEG